jgi:predicted DNA-binding protein
MARTPHGEANKPTPISFRLPASFKRKLKKLAEVKGVTQTSYLRMRINEDFEALIRKEKGNG